MDVGDSNASIAVLFVAHFKSFLVLFVGLFKHALILQDSSLHAVELGGQGLVRVLGLVALALVDVFDSSLEVTTTLSEVGKTHICISVAWLFPSDLLENLRSFTNTTRSVIRACQIKSESDSEGKKALVFSVTFFQ